MKSVRNSPAAFRFDPAVKEALSVIAERDGRSMANMLEWLIKQHCEREGLGWPPVASPGSVATKRNAAEAVAASQKSEKR